MSLVQFNRTSINITKLFIQKSHYCSSYVTLKHISPKRTSTINQIVAWLVASLFNIIFNSILIQKFIIPIRYLILTQKFSSISLFFIFKFFFFFKMPLNPIWPFFQINLKTLCVMYGKYTLSHELENHILVLVGNHLEMVFH